MKNNFSNNNSREVLTRTKNFNIGERMVRMTIYIFLRKFTLTYTNAQIKYTKKILTCDKTLPRNLKSPK